LLVYSGQQQQAILVNSVISQQLQQTQPFSSSLENNFITSSNDLSTMSLITIDENEDTNKLCYDDPIDEDFSFNGKYFYNAYAR
jgi:hypothetical protein